MSELNEKEIIDNIEKLTYEVIVEDDLHNWEDMSPNEIATLIKGLLDLYHKKKEKNKELEEQYKILEVEKVRYNIQYLESVISQTPDTAMVYHSMKKHLETLKEEKIKLEAELQELLEGKVGENNATTEQMH